MSAVTSAPEQNAGGAPVTTSAPMRASASSSSTAAMISSTIVWLSALRRSGSSRVSTPTPSNRSTRSGHQACTQLSPRWTAGECRKNVSTSRSNLYSGFLSPTVRSSRRLRANESTVPAVLYW